VARALQRAQDTDTLLHAHVRQSLHSILRVEACIPGIVAVAKLDVANQLQWFRHADAVPPP